MQTVYLLFQSHFVHRLVLSCASSTVCLSANPAYRAENKNWEIHSYFLLELSLFWDVGRVALLEW